MTGPSTVRFAVKRTAHRRLAKLLGTAEFQSVTFNPFALPDQGMTIDVQLPQNFCAAREGDPLQVEHLHGFLVARLEVQTAHNAGPTE